MPSFIKLNSQTNFQSHEGWRNVPSFKSKGRIVDAQGYLFTNNSVRPKYKITLKQERDIECSEKALNLFIFIAVTFMTLGGALCIKAIWKLGAKNTVTRRFGSFVP